MNAYVYVGKKNVSKVINIIYGIIYGCIYNSISNVDNFIIATSHPSLDLDSEFGALFS